MQASLCVLESRAFFFFVFAILRMLYGRLRSGPDRSITDKCSMQTVFWFFCFQLKNGFKMVHSVEIGDEKEVTNWPHLKHDKNSILRTAFNRIESISEVQNHFKRIFCSAAAK